jgi:hypothetical protein
MDIDGACHCGRITFTARIDPSRVSLCHCTDCQAFSSSAFRVGVAMGAVRQRAELAPKSQIWKRSAMPWLDALHDIPGSSEQQAKPV